MHLYNTNPQLHFGTKLETAKVLEVTSQKIFQSNGIEGCREVIIALNGKPAVGSNGYRKHAIEIGKKITEKYPEIAEATEEINRIIMANPYIRKNELNEQVQPIIAKIGQEIDIII